MMFFVEIQQTLYKKISENINELPGKNGKKIIVFIVCKQPSTTLMVTYSPLKSNYFTYLSQKLNISKSSRALLWSCLRVVEVFFLNYIKIIYYFIF
jgi:hypothetical protein